MPSVKTEFANNILMESYLSNGDLQKIAQQSRMEESVSQHALQTLLQRDLVMLEQKSFQIVAPIFRKWVERYYESL